MNNNYRAMKPEILRKAKQYSMTRSRIKRISASVLALVLILTSAISVSAAAQSLEYSASSSYKSSSFYKKLTEVKLTGDQVTDIVNVAKSQVGYHESYGSDYSGYGSGSGNVTEYGRWYGRQSYWCNVFVSWCANVAGVPASVFPKLSGVSNAYSSTLPAVNAECFSFSSGRRLEAGDLIFCCTCSGSYGCVDHVGLVTAVDDSTIYTVEGNMSDKVMACSYPASSGYSSRLRARINYVARPCYEDNSAKSAQELKDANAAVSFDGNVYMLFDSGVSYKTAIKLSKELGGSLASPKTQREIEKLSELSENGGFGRYFVKSEKECAVVTASGISKSSETRRATGFILKLSLKKFKPANSAAFGGSRYEIYDSKVTYAQAKAIAEAKGGKLTVIENDTEAMLLSLLLKDSKAYFTGAEGTKKELKEIYDSFSKKAEFEKDNNIAVFLNNGSKKLSVRDAVKKSGFIVEYNENEKCTVFYDANGGENAPIEKITESGETIEITSAAPTNKNKAFLGWALEKNGEAVIEAGDKLAPEKDVTLYAVWG